MYAKPMMDTDHAPILLYLWRQRTLYLGELPEVPDLTPAASTLMIGLEKPFLIRNWATGEEAKARAALIPAGTHFGADPLGQPMVNCYLDPLRKDFEHLSPRLATPLGNICLDIDASNVALDTFQHIFQTVMPAHEAYDALIGDVFYAPHPQDAEPEAEQHIRRVIQLIQDDPLSNEPTDTLADAAGISPSQLNRWFKKCVGVPIRRYRLWHRLFITATMMGFGKSLTDAAHEAGFSDSAHLTHTFKSMLGMTPSFVFRRTDRLRIQIGNE